MKRTNISESLRIFKMRININERSLNGVRTESIIS